MKPIATFFLLIVRLIANAQISSTETKLEVKWETIVDQGNKNGLILILKRDTTVIETIYNEFSYTFHLDFNQKYFLSASKDGYITKTIEYLTTNIPSEILKRGFNPFYSTITIFKQSENNIVEFQNPAATIYYESKIEDFTYKTNYTKNK